MKNEPYKICSFPQYLPFQTPIPKVSVSISSSNKPVSCLSHPKKLELPRKESFSFRVSWRKRQRERRDAALKSKKKLLVYPEGTLETRGFSLFPKISFLKKFFYSVIVSDHFFVETTNRPVVCSAPFIISYQLCSSVHTALTLLFCPAPEALLFFFFSSLLEPIDRTQWSQKKNIFFFQVSERPPVFGVPIFASFTASPTEHICSPV